MKMRHDPSMIDRPIKGKKLAAATLAAIAIATAAPAVPAHAMKMHHDCCVYRLQK